MMECSRCDQSFTAQTGLQLHYRDCGRHYQCQVCQYDGLTRRDLLQHRSKQHRIVCEGSDNVSDIEWSPLLEYSEYREEANFCESCEQHVQSDTNPEQHQKVPTERPVNCYGCQTSFDTYSAMIVHIESGNCESKLDKFKLNKSAARCFHWWAYIDEDYRTALSEQGDLWTEHFGPVWPFMCPECDTKFSKLSDLFIHVDSDACDQKLHFDPMRGLARWLDRDYRQRKAQ